ncbi:PIR protein [Plasmodium yoelii]|uniref:PIR protein n=2 Tax=Plasmodium yoelii TaxID=5861 RepID=A0AAE9WNR6_PLAYO|nr:PIR protein [Plasmodium yoelii]WBY57071.1 PIR protein [Plasmodium yoelii yoelii]VTZ78188.1 PIR protein [Plasmodium yoelii]|eukprot:XP_022811006.2 PIR protein [Plasmodium yoelii]
MNKETCKTFAPLRNVISNSDKGVTYQFTTDEDYKNYCTNENCDNDTDKMNARCLHIFDAFFKDKSTFENDAKGNIYIVQYILIWLSYVLSLIESNEAGNRTSFYNKYINGDEKYNKNIDDVTAYKNYKDLIDKNNYILSMDMSIISKFYDAFILLCDICIGVDEDRSNCDNYLEKAKEFAKKYDELNEDYNNGKGSPYNQLLSTLSNDYNNLKNVCNDFPSLPTYSRRLVIKNTLISIGFIFVAVSIFLGIAYKYSLFGFRKRFQKQKLREKIKNIMKKMIH